MSVELRPFGVKCNIRCHYCYQNAERDASPSISKYQMSVMKASLEKEGKPFTLFGGEPLLIPEADLEELWAYGLERFGRNSIQTNAVLVNENHIRMFKKYKLGVGVSIDGPGELNDVRWAGSLEATRSATAKTEAALRRLCHEGIVPTIIVTLHRANALSEKLPRMSAWLQELEELGIRSVRLHILEVDHPGVRRTYALSTEENIEAFLHFARLQKELRKMRFDVFEDIKRLLTGRDQHVTCIWAACDPYTTPAVRGIEGNGQRSNCGRTNKQGVGFVKSDRAGYERYIGLYFTPQEHGGCAGCRYFLMCKGQCPGTALDGDWRNRTEHCLVWKALFEHFEQQLEADGEPVLSDELRASLEAEFIREWSQGRNVTMERLLPTLQEDRHSILTT